MGLRYVVLTGVARDDLPDGGAAHLGRRRFARSSDAVPGHRRSRCCPSDFKGGDGTSATVLDAGPDVFAHNLETVRRLHGRIRPAFGYDRTLDVLRFAKRHRAGQVTKSNLILGMGERPDEVRDGDARPACTPACDILTMGQYLQPDARSTSRSIDGSRPTSSRSTPRMGEEELGFAHVEAGPLVRSSYHAGEQFRRALDASAVAQGAIGR